MHIIPAPDHQFTLEGLTAEERFERAIVYRTHQRKQTQAGEVANPRRKPKSLEVVERIHEVSEPAVSTIISRSGNSVSWWSMASSAAWASHMWGEMIWM